MNQESTLYCCAICDLETHRRCSRCLSVYYCNTEHQRQDWKRHKIECSTKSKKLDNKNLSDIINSSSIKEQLHTEEILKNTNNVNLKTEITNNSKNIRNKDKKEGIVCNDLCESKHNIVLKNHDGNKSVIGNISVNNVGKQKLKSGSVISSVVYTNKDLSKGSAITHEGSSEQEILNDAAQLLSSVEYATSTNVLRTLIKSDRKMPALPSYGGQPPGKVKEYPEASLKGSVAPFSNAPNSLLMDKSDAIYEICQRVIRDMTQYGVCVLDNFLGKDKGLLVLDEVLDMYRSGIFLAGQLVSNPGSTEAQTIRSDRITWIDGKEPYCQNIRQLIVQVDNIILSANKMASNGKMGDFIINGRTKAMVACYPGSGSHYVKHVDNPNRDGRCITAIYYLNMDWDVNTCGGLLRVFPEGTKNQVADIAPIFDRMLFFWSDRRNPHEVQPAFNTRYAITLWYFDSQEREEALRHYKERGQNSTSK